MRYCALNLVGSRGSGRDSLERTGNYSIIMEYISRLAEGLARYSHPGKNTAHRALLQAAEAGAQLEEVGMWKP